MTGIIKMVASVYTYVPCQNRITSSNTQI